MIKIENTETFGWEAAVRGARNPLNSWNKSDSGYSKKWGFGSCGYCEKRYSCVMYETDGADGECISDLTFDVGDNDINLMKRLAYAGTDDGKFMRMITVYADITAPLYWWKEYDTYKVGTVANSCSTMHKIHAKEFTIDDFSHEQLLNGATDVLSAIVNALNVCRTMYIESKDKTYWWQMIQLLPTSYNQKRTVMLNYAVLRNMYHARKNHKLDEWHAFCGWVEKLPYSELITGVRT